MNSPKLSNGALQCIKISCACFARLGWEVLQQADFEDLKTGRKGFKLEDWGTGPGVFGVWGKGLGGFGERGLGWGIWGLGLGFWGLVALPASRGAD